MSGVSLKGIRVRRLTAVIVAALLVISITVGLLIVFLGNKGEFSYTGSELSEYITIGEEAYKGYSLEVATDRVTDEAVERRINNLLYLYRSKMPENNGGEVTSVPVTTGDKVYIYYTVSLNNEGREELVSAPSAFFDVSAYGVGSYSFLPIENIDRSLSPYTVYADGFDEALIGTLPLEHKHSSVETVRSGKVGGTDAIVFSYTDGGKRRSFRTTLAECDALYGEGMSSFLSSTEIGAVTAELKTAIDGGFAVYNNIRIEYATRGAYTPLMAEITFPMHYAIPELRGRSATAEVFFRGSVIYNVPEYNADFVTQKLGIDAESLSKYSGSDTVERHRAMLLSVINAESERVRDKLIEDAVWDHLVDSVAVKELPRDEIEQAYNDIYSGIYLMYASKYSGEYDSPEKFSAWYYGFSSTAEVAAHVMRLAERDVTERLIFYSISRAEGLLPEGEEFTALRETLIEEEFRAYIEDFKATLDALTAEEKEKRLAEHRAEMLEGYGDEYFTELAYYESAFPVILGYATVNVTYAE